VALGVYFAAAHSCLARDTVYLKTGYSLDVDSYTQENQVVVVRVGEGTLQLQAAEIEHIDALPELPPAPLIATPNIDSAAPEFILKEAAYMQGLDEDFVRSVAQVESGMRQAAVSNRGAIGLMQLMPATAAELRVDPTRAHENAQGGAMYLRDLLIRYHGNSALALAAYNAGPGAVAKFGGVPPYEETRRYIVQVLREYGHRVQARKRSLPRETASNKPISIN
jgi:soluble lytic murein transglycosylase-like protein